MAQRKMAGWAARAARNINLSTEEPSSAYLRHLFHCSSFSCWTRCRQSLPDLSSGREESLVERGKEVADSSADDKLPLDEGRPMLSAAQPNLTRSVTRDGNMCTLSTTSMILSQYVLKCRGEIIVTCSTSLTLRYHDLHTHEQNTRDFASSTRVKTSRRRESGILEIGPSPCSHGEPLKTLEEPPSAAMADRQGNPLQEKGYFGGSD